VLGIIRIPPSVVEPLIALSIIVVAIDNMIYSGKAHSRLRLAVAFGFGLVHGLGFAGGVLSSMSALSGSGLWAALTGFTLGIEIGNQAVAMPLFLLLVVGRRFLSQTRQQSLVISGSVLIACGGIYFLVVALKQQLFR
jgi:ABC-type nickel/cobalt efflux system permease component RcnA